MKQRGLNLVKDNAAKLIFNRYENIYGHYYSLGDIITRTSTYMEIDKGHAEREKVI